MKDFVDPLNNILNEASAHLDNAPNIETDGLHTFGILKQLQMDKTHMLTGSVMMQRGIMQRTEKSQPMQTMILM